MTSRHAGYLITLKQELREDDAEATINTIKQIKGIATVKPVKMSIELQLAEERARVGIMQRLYEALNPKIEE